MKTITIVYDRLHISISKSVANKLHLRNMQKITSENEYLNILITNLHYNIARSYIESDLKSRQN